MIRPGSRRREDTVDDSNITVSTVVRADDRPPGVRVPMTVTESVVSSVAPFATNDRARPVFHNRA